MSAERSARALDLAPDVQGWLRCFEAMIIVVGVFTVARFRETGGRMRWIVPFVGVMMVADVIGLLQIRRAFVTIFVVIQTSAASALASIVFIVLLTLDHTIFDHHLYCSP